MKLHHPVSPSQSTSQPHKSTSQPSESQEPRLKGNQAWAHLSSFKNNIQVQKASQPTKCEVHFHIGLKEALPPSRATSSQCRRQPSQFRRLTRRHLNQPSMKCSSTLKVLYLSAESRLPCRRPGLPCRKTWETRVTPLSPVSSI